ncbi:MAG: zinc ribbon domain-containing protein [Phycisphaerales bacterium]
MPTYDYRCTACSHEFEHFQSMKDKPLRKCPSCGKNALERLIGTGGAVIFKGGGFYQTDYRSESYKKAAESDAKPAAPEKASGDSGAKESKSAGADAAKDSKPKAKDTPAKAKPKAGQSKEGS